MKSQTSFLARTILLLLLALGFAGGAAAQTWTNNTAAATATWSGTTNWVGGTPAAGGGATVALTFGGFATGATAYQSTNNLTGNFFLNQLAITNGTLTLQGNPLLFTNNGATMPVLTNNSGYTAVISNNIVLGTNLVVGDAKNITLAGFITGSGSVTNIGSGVLTLNPSQTMTASTNAGTTNVLTVANPAGLVVGQGVSMTSAGGVGIQGGAISLT